MKLKNTNKRKKIKNHAQKKNDFAEVKNLARYRSENNFVEPSK